jgi:hypothetical protein
MVRGRVDARAACGWAVLLLVLGTAMPSYADWHLAPFAGIKFGGATTLNDLDDEADNRKLIFGATITWVGRGIVGVEGDVSFVPNYFTGADSPIYASSLVTTAMGNVVVTAPLGWTRDSLRPYVSGGAGLIRASAEDNGGILTFHRNLGGYNLGGGVVGFITPFTGVKWDARYFKAWGPNEGTAFGSARISYWRATMALVLRY